MARKRGMGEDLKIPKPTVKDRDPGSDIFLNNIETEFFSLAYDDKARVNKIKDLKQAPDQDVIKK